MRSRPSLKLAYVGIATAIACSMMTVHGVGRGAPPREAGWASQHRVDFDMRVMKTASWGDVDAD